MHITYFYITRINLIVAQTPGNIILYFVSCKSAFSNKVDISSFAGSPSIDQ